MMPWIVFTFGTAIPVLHVFVVTQQRLDLLSKAWISSTLFRMDACFKIWCKVICHSMGVSEEFFTSFLTHVRVNKVDAARFNSCQTLKIVQNT
jgi:hypothetical protein